MRLGTVALSPILAIVALACDAGAPNTLSHPEVATGFGVAAYGDSLTQFATGPTWPAHLPSEWLPVVRASIGERAVDGSDRLRRDLDAHLLTSVEDEEVVVLLWGSNDVCSSLWVDLPDGVLAATYFQDQVASQEIEPVLGSYLAAAAESATDVRNHLFAAIARAQELGISVVLAFPPPLGEASACPAGVANPRLESLRAMLRQAAQDAAVPFVDLYEAFVQHQGGLSDLLQADGVHLQENGALLAAGLIQAAIQPIDDAWLQEVLPASPPVP